MHRRRCDVANHCSRRAGAYIESRLERGVMYPSNDVEMKVAARRGLMGRCPGCGGTPLFRSYLKQVHACPSCHAEFGRIRADDAAPWATIIVIGHIFLPLVFFLALDQWMPFWAAMLTYAALLSLLALLLLPRAKGLFIGILWATRAPGVEAG